MNRPRQRPLSIGPLRAFEAVARLSSFRRAGEELHITQPAVSRQIRSLEEELGATLLHRGTRHVELTSDGSLLLRTMAPLLSRLDATVRQIRVQRSRRQVTVTTFASFASLWLLPRLKDFQARHPGIDIRIDASDLLVEPGDPEIDIALRYALDSQVPRGSLALFDEVLTPVASPSLRDMRGQPLRRPADLAHHTLLEEDDQRPSSEYLSWRHWLRLQAEPALEPQRWIFLSFTHQQIQAALAGQGVSLARLALVHESIARAELVEPFGAAGRITSPFRYWLVPWPGRRPRPEVDAFERWLLAQAGATRTALEA
jgi:LysR family glycine cleavage system transcriptional activator